jgi:type II secretory pathway predicted ATPase ExeA
MTNIDEIWQELEDQDRAWGINGNPFIEASIDIEQLRKVYTGRDSEIKTAVQQLRSVNRSRILVYGDIGIGKTAFITMILDLFERKDPGTLTAQISLPAKTELATAALIALAAKMPNDEDAKKILNQLGLLSESSYQKGSKTFKIGPNFLGMEGKTEDTPQNQIQFADLAFNGLLDRALQNHDRVIIAIDDLDKQDPATVKELLLNAQGLLKGRASFILTGHPSGLTQEILLSNRGLFDRTQQLTAIDFDTTKLMLLKYLNSVRQQPKDINDPDAFAPFTADAADLICQRSNGSPRVLNRIGSYAIIEGGQQNLQVIDAEAIERTIDKARKSFRDQFNPQERVLIDSITNQGVFSDSNLSFEELQKLGVKSFAELLPVIEELQRRELIERLPNDGSIAYRLSPLLLPAEPPSDTSS